MSQDNLNVTENITQKHNVTNNNYISQIGAACYNSMLYQPKSKYIPDIDVERLQLHQNKSTACYIQKDLFMLPKDFALFPCCQKRHGNCISGTLTLSCSFHEKMGMNRIILKELPTYETK
jgi:hypothetical protein